MATTGEKFLRLTKAERFVISGHAMDRVEQCTGMQLTEALASALFHRSRHLRVEEMFTLGYRPAYGKRLRRGEKSWYFRFHLFAQELVAVVSQKDESGEYVWVTTYFPSRQSEHYRLADVV